MSAAARFKFCDICRGDDPPFATCTRCKHKFHAECAKISAGSSLEGYTCGSCENEMEEEEDDDDEKEEAEEEKESKKATSAHFTLIKELAKYQQKTCANFLSENSDSFSLWCGKENLSKIVTKGRQHNISQPCTLVHMSGSDFLEVPPNPPYLSSATTLRDYQCEGVSTLCKWFARGIGGILADEMGLGKTLQTIAFLCACKHHLGISGPHLIVTPLAVVQNWCNEIQRFAPTLKFKKLHGGAKEREKIFSGPEVMGGMLDVYVTTYDMLTAEEAFFTDSFPWATITIDEGHILKNCKTNLRRTLNRLRCSFRVLLTGTPLQNNLLELWALLNFVLPEVFPENKSLMFQEGADVEQGTLDRSFCARARDILDSHLMLRRIKLDVEKSLLPKIQVMVRVPMTAVQVRWYTSVLEKDTTAVQSMSHHQLQSILSQLRKVVNHPKQLYNRYAGLLWG